jgi:hypothetical protein
MTAKDVGKVRVGCDRDGGYVMLDDFRNVNSCYSVGIGPEVSWDLDMARRGLPVFQYDHTVKEPPVKHDKLIFTPLGLGTVDNGDRRTLATLVRFDVAPLLQREEIIEGHQREESEPDNSFIELEVVRRQLPDDP